MALINRLRKSKKAAPEGERPETVRRKLTRLSRSHDDDVCRHHLPET